MSLIEWNERYIFNIREIDDQHKKLVGMLNELYDAHNEGKVIKIMINIIRRLIEYTKYHFSTEEKYFDQFDYPEKVEHKQEHKEFCETVLDFEKKIKNGEVLLSSEVLSFLKEWLISHLEGTDKKYVPFLIEKGINKK
ncbi:MAG: hemerythrin family protein [Cyclobacteriaceae bacterium]|nr:hemerythrin family protein [Cyclobacteriaceae bacterium]MCK5707717.1 hemerythrin family protein [Candidatus Auribacterota bacterium]